MTPSPPVPSAHCLGGAGPPDFLAPAGRCKRRGMGQIWFPFLCAPTYSFPPRTSLSPCAPPAVTWGPPPVLVDYTVLSRAPSSRCSPDPWRRPICSPVPDPSMFPLRPSPSHCTVAGRADVPRSVIRRKKMYCNFFFLFLMYCTLDPSDNKTDNYLAELTFPLAGELTVTCRHF